MSNLARQCGKRFYRWGVPKPDRRAVLAKGWGTLGDNSGRVACEEWSQDVKQDYERERLLVELLEKARAATPESEIDRLRPLVTSLAERWRNETRFCSSLDEKFLHPAYQSIMAMGPSAVPLVLEEFQARRGHWSWALQFMTGANPVQEGANVDGARESWLKWGKQKGYLK